MKEMDIDRASKYVHFYRNSRYQDTILQLKHGDSYVTVQTNAHCSIQTRTFPVTEWRSCLHYCNSVNELAIPPRGKIHFQSIGNKQSMRFS